jgi:hypothetical protein
MKFEFRNRLVNFIDIISATDSADESFPIGM